MVKLQSFSRRFARATMVNAAKIELMSRRGGFARFLAPQARIGPVRREQFRMAAALDDVASLHDENAVAVDDGIEPVRDEHDRALTFQAMQRLDQQRLVLRIE